MSYGFYITDKGRELITQSIHDNTKVNITKACFGSGGDPESERDYGILDLKNQFYEKELLLGIDSYVIDENDPTQICINTVLPNEVSGTINEMGYKDDSDNLIIYGVVREEKKEAGTDAEAYQIRYENWVKLQNSQVDKIVVNVMSPEMENLNGQVKDLSSRLSNVTDQYNTLSGEVSSLTNTIDGLSSSVGTLSGSVSTLTSSVDSVTKDLAQYKTTVENTYTKTQDFNTYKTTVENTYTKSTDFNSYKSTVESTYAKDSELQELITRVTTIENTLNGLAETLEELI